MTRPIVNCLRDCADFLAKLPSDISTPSISITEDNDEVALQWLYKPDCRAIVDFTGDGGYGYAYKVGDNFKPGKIDAAVSNETLPNDLIEYLRNGLSKTGGE